MSAAQRLAAQRAIDQLGVVARRRRRRRQVGLRVAARRPRRPPGQGRRPLPQRRRGAASWPRSCATGRCASTPSTTRTWSFDTNKGYPCPVHKAALQAYGPSVIHRRTWVFMDHYVPWPASPASTDRSNRPCSRPVEYVVRGVSRGTHVLSRQHVLDWSAPAGRRGPRAGRRGGGGRRSAPGPTRIEQSSSPSAAKTSSSVRSSPTKTTLRAASSSRSSATASALLVARVSSSTTPVTRQHVGAGDVLGLLAAARRPSGRRARDAPRARGARRSPA